MIYIGVDPGLHGGLAWVISKKVDAVKMPTVAPVHRVGYMPNAPYVARTADNDMKITKLKQYIEQLQLCSDETIEIKITAETNFFSYLFD